MQPFAIRVQNLSKEFEVYDRPIDIALELFSRKSRHRVFRALDNVTFDVGRGEVMGIIGANGAGKSTLLKIITGVLDATSGSVEISGKVTAILELGLGFNAELPGRDNIHLSGLLYGMSQAEIDRKYDSICEFSGLGDFIDRPVKTYSSGMMARLAFSIATAVDPDILIIDEALAAGDAMFVQKCLKRIRNFCNSGKTVLLVSHGTGLLAQLCKRVVWLDNGVVRECGSALSVIQAYDLAAHAGADKTGWVEEVPVEASAAAIGAISSPASLAGNSVPSAPAASIAAPDATSSVMSHETSVIAPGSVAAEPVPVTTPGLPPFIKPPAPTETRKVLRRGPFFIDKVELLDSGMRPTMRLTTLLPFTIRLQYHCKGPIPEGTLGVALAVNRAHDLAPVSQWFTQNIMPYEKREDYDLHPTRIKAGPSGTIDLDFAYVPYAGGDYILSIGLLANEPANWEFYEYRHLGYSFSVDDAGSGVGAPIFFRPVLRHFATTEVETKAQVAHPNMDGLRTQDVPLTLREEIAKICVIEGGYPDRWPRHTECPCCGGKDLRRAFSKFDFTHKQCGTCNFVFVDPYPPDDVIHKLYAGQYYTNVREFYELPRVKGGEDSTPFTAPRSTLIDIVERVSATKSKGRWLEVGGGLGAFANLIRYLKPEWSVTLNEFNPRSLEIAREVYGLDTSQRTAAEMLAAGERFDVISSVAVLEHLAAPMDFVKDYARMLAPGGVLVTVVPNFTSLNAKISHGSSANVVPPYHLSLFNKSNFRRLLERSEMFDTVGVEESGPAAFSLLHLIDYGEKWDVTIPTEAVPDQKGIMLDAYDNRTGHTLNTLAEANQKVGEYFAQEDGRLLLIAIARTKH